MRIAALPLIIILSALLVSGCKEKTDTDAVAANVDTLPETEPKIVEVFGRVKTESVHHITLGFSAEIEEILVHPGQRVEKEMKLARLDFRPFNNQIRMSEIALREAELKLVQLRQEYEQSGRNVDQEFASLKISISALKEEIRVLEREYETHLAYYQEETDPEVLKLKNDLATGNTALSRIREEYQRKKDLFDRGAIPKQELDEAESSLEQKEGELKSLSYSLSALLATKEDALAVQRILIAQKEAALEDYQNQLDHLMDPEMTAMEIQAQEVERLKKELEDQKRMKEKPCLQDPFVVCDLVHGVVESVEYARGDTAGPEKPLLKVLDLDTLYVEADVPEDFIRDIGIGNNAVIIPLADPDNTYTGKVFEIAGMAIEKNGETIVPVMLSIDDHDGFLLTNFNVDIQIEKTESEAEQEA